MFNAKGSSPSENHFKAKKMDANVQATNLGDKVIQIAKEHAAKSGSPLKIIAFDHARLVFGGDPNDAEDVIQLTRVLTDPPRVMRSQT